MAVKEAQLHTCSSFVHLLLCAWMVRNSCETHLSQARLRLAAAPARRGRAKPGGSSLRTGPPAPARRSAPGYLNQHTMYIPPAKNDGPTLTERKAGLSTRRLYWGIWPSLGVQTVLLRPGRDHRPTTSCHTTLRRVVMWPAVCCKPRRHRTLCTPGKGKRDGGRRGPAAGDRHSGAGG